LGRADSTTGHSSTTVAEMVAVPSAGLCVWQCDCVSAGARHVASHHARAGATAPIVIAHASTNHRVIN
jgi:hypothetical protein